MPGQRASEEQRREQILQAALRVAVRDRLDGLTIRRVAREAAISAGLVFFHFESKERLLVALLRWLLETTIVAEVGPDILSRPTPAEQLLALVHQELQHVQLKRDRLELFFDYWVLGSHTEAMRWPLRAALDRYHAAFLPLAEALITSDPGRYAQVSAHGLTTLIVSTIQGYAIQVIKGQDNLDLAPLLATLTCLLGARP